MIFCQLFIDARETNPKRWDVQLQANGVTVDLVAIDLGFLRELREFIAETVANPDFRDIDLGGGRFRAMPRKSCDLSPFFTTAVEVMKNGEYDDAYVALIGGGESFRLAADIRGEVLEALIGELDDAIEA